MKKLLILAALSAAIITGCATRPDPHGTPLATSATKAQGWCCVSLESTVIKDAIADGEKVSADDRNRANADRTCKKVYRSGYGVTIYGHSVVGNVQYAHVKFEDEYPTQPLTWFAVKKLLTSADYKK